MMKAFDPDKSDFIFSDNDPKAFEIQCVTVNTV